MRLPLGRTAVPRSAMIAAMNDKLPTDLSCIGQPAPSGEDALIARYFAPLAKHPGALGLIDDVAAITPPAGCELVLTADAVVGGIHFFPDDPPDTTARKALRVNLSDLAAKGAKPLGFLLTLGLPRGVSETWLAAFSAGLGEDIAQFDCPLLGGDTVRTPDAAIISVAIVGSVPAGTMVKRSGARAGDRIVVTGTVGDAALGLRLRQAEAESWKLSAAQRAHLLQRYLVPQPRSAAAEALRLHASGAMDVSDGLAGDLTKLCRASGVTARIDAAAVPLSDAARAALAADPALIETVLTGGDDYEVVAAVPPAKLAAFTAAAQAAGVAVTEIGDVTAGGAPPVFRWHGRQLEFARRSFSHF